MPRLKLVITHSVLNINAEKAFDSAITVGDLKQKLEMVVGTKPSNMILQHRNHANEIVCTLQPDDLPIGKFDLEEYSNVHVVDTDAKQGIVANLHALQSGQNVQVPKYEISAEEYAKRDNTFAKWKETHLKDFYHKKAEEEKEQMAAWDEALKQKNIKLNDRCEIGQDKQMKHRGKVAFIGSTQFDGKGVWIGVQLDEPYGDNNGSVKGQTYFQCGDKYGIFVRPDNIAVGDYPVIDELELSDNDDEEL
mmetsp:Transcript_73609/g.117350  ORF Transcript_73609/g.117350 Transcript_73609/m.117350 type:complete len:249 (-) Transcript_73609:660-1406(-)